MLTSLKNIFLSRLLTETVRKVLAGILAPVNSITEFILRRKNDKYILYYQFVIKYSITKSISVLESSGGIFNENKRILLKNIAKYSLYQLLKSCFKINNFNFKKLIQDVLYNTDSKIILDCSVKYYSLIDKDKVEHQDILTFPLLMPLKSPTT